MGFIPPNTQGPKVLIIGAGISGPVLALLLRRKGYSPLVLEKVRSLGDAGSGLMLMPNGLKVLSLLGLSAPITDAVPNIEAVLDCTWQGEEIGGMSCKGWKERYGEVACGVKRTVLNLALKNALEEAGIPLLEGWKLANIIEDGDSVTAISADGRQEKGSFLIGGDGIRSATRKILLEKRGIKEAEPVFTNLVQVAGVSRTPQALRVKKAALRNFYGPDKHFITYPAFPAEAGMTGWAITSRSSTQDIETWQSMSDSELLSFKAILNKEFEGWCPEVNGLVSNAEKVIKYGLYDREALDPENWVSESGRCVLVGDAAHPTSPHLGQGANQAFEDCWWLSQLLPDVSEGKGPERKELKAAFKAFAEKRQPRTKELVKGARLQGEMRVIGGVAEGRKRDELLKEGWRDEEAVRAKYDGLLKEPFLC